MKSLLTALFLFAPVAANAACSPTDFVIQNFTVTVSSGGIRPRMNMKGQLVNHCAQAAAAELQIQAKDAGGTALQTKKGWPAGTTNIAPGQSVTFDLGRLFHYQSDMRTYAVGVISVRSW
ncbi:MAG: hypothetical protein KGJ63_10590 [Pseudomonadota bacterium]|nr:hypothetical protein [Pseudomonadota bacterium]